MNRDWRARTLGWSVALVWLGGLVAVAHPAGGQGGSRQDLSAYLPPGQGRALVVKTCTGCHNLRGTMQLRAPAQKWEALVLDMGARGAPIMLDDVDLLVKYLSDVFGPDAPPFTDVSSATKHDLLKLPRVTPESADRLIAARAAAELTSSEQIRTALGLDAPAFEKIKYYLYVNTDRAGDR